MTKITIRIGDTSYAATLNDSETATAIKDALPISGAANLWGDEIYFSIPVNAPLENDASDQHPALSLAYWPPGTAFCIIWGPTPASHGSEPRFASPVNLIGKIDATPEALSRSESGAAVSIELA